ncbi:hypothetical protein QOY93_08850 [Leclercia adecarboxylata]|uniref:hypothetical protein n=1 Tax=Leclercia adecarboxylata TaxID=83655 RepID=UPI00254E38C6|nr:hypothetical protein [Leclercia adecarboxylata]MDK4745464.1 hypothetical protein [Leclercia adecarboxylata]
MKSILARDPITMLAVVLHDMIYPHFDFFTGKELDDNSRMRAVKNTVSYAFGYKSASDLANYIKQTSQKQHFENFKSELIDKLNILKDLLDKRFGNPVNLNIFKCEAIILKASRHYSGRHNLEYQVDNRRVLPVQLKGLMIGNTDYREFYQASLKLYHFLLLAGFNVEFPGLIRQDELYSVLIPLNPNSRILLRDWIYRRHNPANEAKIRQAIDEEIFAAAKLIGLVFQTHLYGEFGKTVMPMIIMDDENGVIIPDVYFTKESVQGHELHLYR